MKSLLLVLLLVYLGAGAYLYLFQRSYIYYPSFTRPAAVEPDLRLERDGVTLKGWRVNPGQPRALIYFGGNAERIEHNIPDFRALLPRHTVYMLAYRGYGDSGGSPSKEALVGDALALYDRVAGDHEAVALMGRSLGSAIAVAVAAEREVSRLALVTPFDSLASIGRRAFPIFPVELLLKDRYPAVEWAAGVEAETLILYAEDDEIVPTSSVQRLAAGFTATTPAVVAVPEAGHNDISGYPAYRTALAGFFTGGEPGAAGN